jgi:hypothetical protein
MVLYQADIIDEELAIQWGTHVSKKYVDKDVSKKVRKSAEAFVAVSCFQSVLVKTDDVVAPDCRG